MTESHRRLKHSYVRLVAPCGCSMHRRHDRDTFNTCESHEESNKESVDNSRILSDTRELIVMLRTFVMTMNESGDGTWYMGGIGSKNRIEVADVLDNFVKRLDGKTDDMEAQEAADKKLEQ